MELARERAAALTRIAGTLETLLDRLNALGAELRERPDADRASRLAAYAALRSDAVRYRWYLEVQREALGLRRHDPLDRLYPIPPPL